MLPQFLDMRPKHLIFVDTLGDLDATYLTEKGLEVNRDLFFHYFNIK